MVFVGQTNLSNALVQNCNKFIYQTCVNSHTKFEEIWIVSNVIANNANLKSPLGNKPATETPPLYKYILQNQTS